MGLQVRVLSALCDACGQEIYFVDGERALPEELETMANVHVCYQRERYWIEAIVERLHNWHRTQWTGEKAQRLYRANPSTDAPQLPLEERT